MIATKFKSSFRRNGVSLWNMRKLFAAIEQSSDEKRCFKTSTLRVGEKRWALDHYKVGV